ncbi:neurogenic locus notch homolog protein 1-like isoform X2 [Alosa alosa]|nr:neurogenic locus notch homolog protein 1-like isoform X2 [Alosa alosa]XP_048109190.1 neurogenic locus notch homolog protein 1-like isoform X2 [Alosa alosa]
MTARMEEPVWMESTPTTASVHPIGQVCTAQTMWTSATCSPTPASTVAHATTRWAATTVCLLCHLTDACMSSPCRDGSQCFNNPINGMYNCMCQSGYRGSTCYEDIDECSIGMSPCEHNGLCINTEGSFTCNCTQGYTGPRCEQEVNECLSNPCKNDAT